MQLFPPGTLSLVAALGALAGNDDGAERMLRAECEGARAAVSADAAATAISGSPLACALAEAEAQGCRAQVTPATRSGIKVAEEKGRYSMCAPDVIIRVMRLIHVNVTLRPCLPFKPSDGSFRISLLPCTFLVRTRNPRVKSPFY